ncbi:MAG: anti-sigma factor [Chitinophagaceae bacterium]|nr:anti-sigma factor [Chitinophagaceae bacterium]
MNIQEYISSGIVEAYVLGLATESEVQELRQLMLQYPELRAAVQEQEDVLVRYAQQNAIAPPPQLRQTIWEALQGEKSLDESQPTIVEPAYPATEKWHRPAPRRPYALAASLALLIASGLANLWLLNNNQQKNTEIAGLKQSQRVLAREKNEALAAVEKTNESLRVLSLPRLQKISLAGVGAHEGQYGLLYWDKASGDVFLDLSPMPQAPAGKQYQLWAIIDGKPVDAGVYIPGSMARMKTIARAEMFAITMEKEGGSPVPTLDQMVVAGKTS